MGELWTAPQLRQRFKVSSKQIEHAISSRGIQHTSRIGLIRLFDELAVARVEAALRETGALADEVASESPNSPNKKVQPTLVGCT